MKKLLLLFCAALFGVMHINAETWTPVGTVQWTEGALTARSTNYNKTWSVLVERSDSRPQVFRLQPYASNPFSNFSNHRSDNVYVYLHTENPNQVYIEYYIYYFYYSSSSSSWYCHVWQRCPENGFDSRYYGTITNNTTIEFPIGSFVVDELTTSSPRTAPSSSARNSTYVHKIVFPEGILDAPSTIETFVNIGKGMWEDCFFSDSEAKEITFERSTLRTDVFRATPYEDDASVLIHTNNLSKIWLEPFTASNYTFTQQCSENNVNASKYGTMTNGRIEIPSEYFSILNTSTNQTQTVSGRKLVITLPEGYNTPIEDDNGIFMGITSFNDEINNLPIMVLNQSTEPTFLDFVDKMEMKNATLLYYAVDQAITTLTKPTYPDNLSNAMIITFTDGLDQGSLAMKPEHLTSRNYAQYLSERIADTKIQGLPLQAYTIGLKSNDVADDDLFMLNLESLATEGNAHSVTDIEGVQNELTKIYDELSRQTSQRVFSITVPMMSHGDKYRFTLDSTIDPSKVEDSKMWVEGVFDITDFSLNNIIYHGFTSTSGSKITAKREGVYTTFTFEDCRDEDGEILDIDKNAIDQWTYIASSNIWQHNVENDKEGKINIEDIRTSAAIMFVLDCSSSLGDLFPVLKETAKAFIDRLAGGNGDYTAIGNITMDSEEWDANAPVEYYNLQGIRVTTPTNGVYIRRQGNNVKKILMK